MFEIASNPEIPLSQVRERRFDLIERAQDLAQERAREISDQMAREILEVTDEDVMRRVVGYDRDPVIGPVMDAYRNLPWTNPVEEDPNP